LKFIKSSDKGAVAKVPSSCLTDGGHGFSLIPATLLREPKMDLPHVSLIIDTLELGTPNGRIKSTVR
jgi:hypothetical protein